MSEPSERSGTTARPGPIDTRTLWRGGRLETIVSYLVAGATVAAGVLLLGEQVGRHIDGFETWIVGLGAWAPATFILLYAVLSSIFVPDIVLGIVAGTSFGFARGLAAVATGSVGGASLQYALARRLLKPTIDRFLRSRPALVAVQTGVRRQEFRLQLLIRLTPLNRALTSYVLGAAGVGFRRFVAACVGLVPSLCLEVYVGDAAKHLARISSRPAHTLVLPDVALIAGLAAAIAAIVVVSRTARKAFEIAATAAAPVESPVEARDKRADESSRHR